MAENSDNRSLLLFRVGPVLCCVPSLPVISIIQPPKLTRPPGSDTARPGIFKYSGNIINSLDLRFKFGVDQDQWAEPCRVIITQITPGNVGFRVDEIQEVMGTPGSGWGTLPPLLPRGIFTQTLLLNKKIYLYTEFDNLFKIPTSGYLRTYIAQLLETQKVTQPQHAVKTTVIKTDTENKQSIDKKEITDNKATNGAHLLKANTHSDENVHKLSDYVIKPVIEPATESHAKKSTGVPEAISPGDGDIKKTDSETAKKASKLKYDAVNNDEKIKPVQVNNIINTHETNGKTSTAGKKYADEGITSSSTIKSNKVIKAASFTKPNIESNRIDSKTKITTHSDSSVSKSVQNNIISSTKPEEKQTGSLQTAHSNHNKTKNSSGFKKDDSKIKINKNQSSTSGFIFIIVLILISIPVLVWYLNGTEKVILQKQKRVINKDNKELEKRTASINSQKKIQNTPQEDSLNTTTTKIKTEISTNVTNSKEDTPNNDVSVEVITVSTGSGVTPLKNPTSKTEQSETIETVPIETSSANNNEQTDYRADIQSDKAGITIILEAPDATPVFKQAAQSENKSETNVENGIGGRLKIEISNDDSIKTITGVSTNTQSPNSDNSVTSQTESPGNRLSQAEIIHIVVKGDTLWHIAIRYVNNPYRYPELARLSNIKNPDLIYPGNRVRIIKKNHHPR